MKPFMKKILLIGFRGSGKTTIAKALAEALNLPFIDADEEIEKREGKSIGEIVKALGWAYFRNLEREFVRSLQGKEDLVCALGGGAILHQKEIEDLKRESLILWINASLEEIKKRLKGDVKTSSQRPPLTDLSWEEELTKLYYEREPYYEKFSHLKVETEAKALEDLLKDIINLLKKEVQNGKHYS